MRALKRIYDFITGGSIVTPIGLALALIVAFTLPSMRPEAFCALIVLTFVGSAFERPT